MINIKICTLFISLTVLSLMPYLAQGQGIEITSGSNITVNGIGTIEINNGGFINNGSYNKGTEMVTFSGNTTKTISGSSKTDLYKLSITNSMGITTQLGQLSLHNLTIGAGSNFTIDPTKEVIVTDVITNNAGNSGLIIKSAITGTASLVHNTNTVPATVRCYMPGSAEAWHFISSPVEAQSISGTWLPTGSYGNGTGYDLYLWNEPTNCWIYKLNTTATVNWNTVNPGSNFMVGRGYLYSLQAANPTMEFIGNLNNGNQSIALTFSSSDVSQKGFNLVGNPYPSSIDWGASIGWARSSLVNTGGGYDMWIWNPVMNNYGVYNSANVDGMGTNSVTRYIAAMQGYFVRTSNSGSLNMNNDVRVLDGKGNLFKSKKQNVSKLSLCIKSDASYGSDEIQLRFGYTGNQNSTLKLFSKALSAPSLYMASKGDSLSVRYLTNTEENPAVPLMFTPGMNGNYTLNCNFDQSNFDTVMLEDRQTHCIQNMKLEQTYSFKASKTDDANRFVLYFGNVTYHADKELSVRIYTAGNRLIADLTLINKETVVFVYDIMGRILLQQKLQGGIQHNFNINARPQMLIVSLENPDGSICRKLTWVGK